MSELRADQLLFWFSVFVDIEMITTLGRRVISCRGLFTDSAAAEPVFVANPLVLFCIVLV